MLDFLSDFSSMFLSVFGIPFALAIISIIFFILVFACEKKSVECDYDLSDVPTPLLYEDLQCRNSPVPRSVIKAELKRRRKVGV